MNRLLSAALLCLVFAAPVMGTAAQAQSVPPYINIITSTDCIGNLRGQPLDSGTLTVTAVGNDGSPLSFSIPGSMVGLAGMPQVFLANGELVGTLSLPNPAVTSPQGIGYTFTFSGDGHSTTFSKVAISADQNGNFDLCKLNVGDYSMARPVAYPGGIWSPAASYISGSVVKFTDGNTYLAIAPSTGQSPAYNATYWSLISGGGGNGSGSPGTAATISVGQTFTGNPGSQAQVTNVGNSTAAVLQFTVPAGAQGATGPAGVAGPTGPTGPAGPTGVPTAASIAALIQFQAGCSTAGYVWSPQSDSCVVAGGAATVTASTCAGALTLTLTPGDHVFDITNTANCTLSFATSAATSVAQRATVIIHPGGFTTTAPVSSSTLDWFSGAPPLFSPTTNTLFDLVYSGTGPVFGRY